MEYDYHNEPEAIRVVRAKVFHHYKNRGTCVAVVDFSKDKEPHGGYPAALTAADFTTSRPGEIPWWGLSRVELEGVAKEHGYCRDTRVGDRILIEYDDGSNEIYTVEDVNPIMLYCGAK
jgi:hypothetical protein